MEKPAIRFLTRKAPHNFGSDNWLAWANDDTAAHYAAIHCLHQSTEQLADIPLPQSATLGFRFIAQ